MSGKNAQNIFYFAVFFYFDDFTICFATGGARRKLQNHQKRKHQKMHFREHQKNKNLQKQENKICFGHFFPTCINKFY